VYRNQKCAKCHNVVDGVPFDKILTCKPYNDLGMKSFDRVLIEAYSDFNNSGCIVHFFLPSEAKDMDLRQFRCFPSISSTYSFSNRFPISNRTELCKFGPLMPYFDYRTWYHNFYCSMDDIPQTVCGEVGFYRDTFTGKGFQRSMAILLSENAISTSHSTVTKEVHQEACLSVKTQKVGQFA